eukprot:Gb_40465 [translate_table: standard]
MDRPPLTGSGSTADSSSLRQQLDGLVGKKICRILHSNCGEDDKRAMFEKQLLALHIHFQQQPGGHSESMAYSRNSAIVGNTQGRRSKSSGLWHISSVTRAKRCWNTVEQDIGIAPKEIMGYLLSAHSMNHWNGGTLRVPKRGTGTNGW